MCPTGVPQGAALTGAACMRPGSRVSANHAKARERAGSPGPTNTRRQPNGRRGVGSYLSRPPGPDRAGPEELAEPVRGHWTTGNRVRHVRDLTYGGDRCRARRAQPVARPLLPDGRRHRHRAPRRAPGHIPEASRHRSARTGGRRNAPPDGAEAQPCPDTPKTVCGAPGTPGGHRRNRCAGGQDRVSQTRLPSRQALKTENNGPAWWSEEVDGTAFGGSVSMDFTNGGDGFMAILNASILEADSSVTDNTVNPSHTATADIEQT